MRKTASFLTLGVFAVLVSTSAPGRLPALQAQEQAPSQPPVVFRGGVDLVTSDVIVRDLRNDQFVSDLKAEEFEVYEDGVKQQIVSVVLTHGGRVFNVKTPPRAPIQEGVILPTNRPTNDAAGRVFLIFIDDLHLDFQVTSRTRDLIKRMLHLLIHEGDMFGVVSSGYSSLSEQLSYDRQILDSLIDKVQGGGLRPQEIVKGMQSSRGPTELRYRAHVAFKTMYDLVNNLQRLQNRRKAIIYISSGYDFNPFEESRLSEQAKRANVEVKDLESDPFFRNQQSQQMLAEADLVGELHELTRAANRANATFYTIDPRGLVAGPDVDQDIGTAEWNAYVRDTQDSLRVLAEETGGFPVVNMNDFDKALKRIDNETSDYYVLGYYSSNPDPLKRRRRVEIRTTRTGLNVWSRGEYTLRPMPPTDQR
ncbi:MAG TPA: VWA domain-containing protein [Vicinamibacterales bacterium]|nr:VWA domain-containing protein [Vicinamibacterales bacterium]